MEITVDFIWKMILSAGLGANFGVERAKQKRLEALRLWLELNHDQNNDDEHQDENSITED